MNCAPENKALALRHPMEKPFSTGNKISAAGCFTLIHSDSTAMKTRCSK
jgi:hypothetical protein